MRAYFGFVLRHRVLVVVVCLAITALAGWSMSRATMASSLGELTSVITLRTTATSSV